MSRLLPLSPSRPPQHRVATNDLWALDLRGGLATQRRDSPSSDYLKWVRVDTIGKPPAARGHHAAVSSAQGGNLFVAFGCDATEMVCYDDAYMLDTTYPQGHYWQQLPVGMLRPAPRQMLTAWVHEASLIVSGGCTPAQDSANDHCYSDVWELPLEGLMQVSAAARVPPEGHARDRSAEEGARGALRSLLPSGPLPSSPPAPSPPPPPPRLPPGSIPLPAPAPSPRVPLLSSSLLTGRQAAQCHRPRGGGGGGPRRPHERPLRASRERTPCRQ